MTDARQRCALAPENLRWHCDESLLAGGTPGQQAAETMLGQDVAVRAIETGVSLRGPGTNVVVVGRTGSGRSFAVHQVVGPAAAARPIPPDRVFVFNFADPGSPRLVTLPPGRGAEFRKAMGRFVEVLEVSLPELLDSVEFAERIQRVVARYAKAEEAATAELARDAEAAGFSLLQVGQPPQVHVQIVPVLDGHPVGTEELNALVSAGKLTKTKMDDVTAAHAKLGKRLEKLARQSRETARAMRDELAALVESTAGSLLNGHLQDLRTQFPEIAWYFDDLERDVLAALDLPAGAGPPQLAAQLNAHLPRYAVNVVADRADLAHAPVIHEAHPTFSNLFGTIAPRLDGIELRPPDHTSISGGSLLAADGGFLVMDARSVVTEVGAWEALKRTLRSGRLEIRSTPLPMFTNPIQLTPEAIPIDVKVILLAEPHVAGIMGEADTEFSDLFKVVAELDPTIGRDEGLEHMAEVVTCLCHREGLLPVAAGGLAALAEHGVRLAGRRTRMITRLSALVDVVREADLIARRGEGREIAREDVRAALDGRAERGGLLRRTVLEATLEDLLLIQTEGERAGEVNGLSVYDLGENAFGKPTKITAACTAGAAGIINVEREARLSGGIYDKGVLIISGWLRRRYARERPLALSASLCFEQSYAGVDGDSASCAEIFAILSDLSGLPVAQGVAVTGSVSQHGQIQPIGGVNEKIEGFFDLCAARGLTGEQGCVIPGANVEDLMLREDVVDAVGDGRFHVWALDSLADGVEILTGRSADEVDAVVQERLDHFADAVSAEGKGAEVAPSGQPGIPVRAAPEESGGPLRLRE